ncbi:MAG: 4Fe-4S binding protein, partial [Planctomycetota bacterium]|nr:4Fe-4S binding protein [Planctomycetota bacterium]
MERLFPVYTQETECHDCYKCVRQCPVKAIRVENERAKVAPERCVACGRCVVICPSGAKRVRDDLGRAKRLLLRPGAVCASVAPSWAATHPEWSQGQLIAALRRLGFEYVSETALGAQELSAALANELGGGKPGLHISSACPAVVDLIRKHIPGLAGAITAAASPALTHCRLLKEKYGEDATVLFIGPCAAKKTEADENPSLMSLALTFAELDRWLAERNINPALLSPREDDVLALAEAAEGVLYPLEGGMIETMRHYGFPDSLQARSMSGLRRLKISLEHIDPGAFGQTLFLEGLACDGGCVNGPCSTVKPSPLEGSMAVRSRARLGPRGPRPGLWVERSYIPRAGPRAKWSEKDILGALARVGKHKPEDELNCGGCGYDTCRGLAQALLAGDAETSMCASYMRGIAQRTANALFRCMPSGVVIVGTDLRIVEANAAFVGIFGDECAKLMADRPGLAGVQVEDILPCGNLLRAALRSGKDIRRERLKMRGLLLDLVIFVIEEYKTVGAIVADVTKNELRRDQIARRAREVIARNISTVQEIASRLGEHMADTEILLNSIAEGYGDAG